VAITLVRAVGELSRNDLPERPGHAGWPAPVPGAQSLGAYRASFALLLHGPRSAESLGEIERTADDVLLPLRGRSLRSVLAIPPSTSGVELSGDGLAFSSCKPSDQGEWMVLRCVNITDEGRTAMWRLPWPPSEVRHATMDETPGAGIVPDGNTIRVTVGARGVSTILVR
jgi:alpha-mannosidase